MSRKFRFQFEVTYKQAEHIRTKKTHRWARSREEAEFFILKRFKNPLSISILDDGSLEEGISSDKQLPDKQECHICEEPAVMRGWCIKHYVKTNM